MRTLAILAFLHLSPLMSASNDTSTPETGNSTIPAGNSTTKANRFETAYSQLMKPGAATRGFYVLLGLMVIVLIYFVFRAFRYFVQLFADRRRNISRDPCDGLFEPAVNESEGPFPPRRRIVAGRRASGKDRVLVRREGRGMRGRPLDFLRPARSDDPAAGRRERRDREGEAASSSVWRKRAAARTRRTRSSTSPSPLPPRWSKRLGGRGFLLFALSFSPLCVVRVEGGAESGPRAALRDRRPRATRARNAVVPPPPPSTTSSCCIHPEPEPFAVGLSSRSHLACRSCAVLVALLARHNDIYSRCHEGPQLWGRDDRLDEVDDSRDPEDATVFSYVGHECEITPPGWNYVLARLGAGWVRMMEHLSSNRGPPPTRWRTSSPRPDVLPWGMFAPTKGRETEMAGAPPHQTAIAIRCETIPGWRNIRPHEKTQDVARPAPSRLGDGERMKRWSLLMVLGVVSAVPVWRCPVPDSEAGSPPCSCDIPHTMRCVTRAKDADPDRVLVGVIHGLRGLEGEEGVSLLDLSLQGVRRLPEDGFGNVSLQGLVVSTGDLVIPPDAFRGLAMRLVALGLPGNGLKVVPMQALSPLTGLQRLDLSKNELESVPAFRTSLDDLELLDLSSNKISKLAPYAFAGLKSLRSLSLNNNSLDAEALKIPLVRNGSSRLEELSLRGNGLKGAVTPDFLPPLDGLKSLDLSENDLSWVKRGALGASTPFLRRLILAGNQVEVVEDDAFAHLPKLAFLDLSRNRMVAVSARSLSGLGGLRVLRLDHNHLRAITGDLVGGLTALQVLGVRDNDISIVEGRAFANATVLKKIELHDNPLHCDCRMAEFGSWLSRNPYLSEEEKASAVCATPPVLENAVLSRLEASQLTCEDDLHGYYPGEATRVHRDPPESHFKLEVEEAFYDGEELNLEFGVDADVGTACNALFVYEEVSGADLLLEAVPVPACNRSMGGRRIHVAFVDVELVQGRRYRFCLSVVKSEAKADDEALWVGCSDPTTLRRGAVAPEVTSSGRAGTAYKSRITAFYANMSAGNSVSVFLRLDSREKEDSECGIQLILEAGEEKISETVLCNVTKHDFKHVPPSDTYRSCAKVLGEERDFTCVDVVLTGAGSVSVTAIVLTALFAVLCALAVLAMYAVARHVVKARKRTAILDPDSPWMRTRRRFYSTYSSSSSSADEQR
ncbi:unnamed protein product [Darwinula stevensoni]|uniref:LRRCT domain-containing protein n=1 Tax=Darwinula stevensoni TaxID=69355 RepID=A0A7R9FNW3_9CRUS|nr:unnamed protein product [Darwinula stevensoni]CAG0897265.1 unnamed protein product [Darwinula stevensoni]